MKPQGGVCMITWQGFFRYNAPGWCQDAHVVTSGCEAPALCLCAHVVSAVLRCEAPGGVWTLRWQVLRGRWAAEGSTVKVWFLFTAVPPADAAPSAPSQHLHRPAGEVSR